MLLTEMNKIEPTGDPDLLKTYLQRHKHEPGQFELLYFLGGSGQIVHEEQYIPFKKGILHLIGPEEFHLIESAPGEKGFSCYSLLLEISDSVKNAPLNRNREQLRNRELGDQYRSFFDELYYKMNHPHPLMAESAAYQIFSFLYEIIAGEATASEEDSEICPNLYIRKAKTYIHQHLFLSFSLKDLCHEMQISEEYLIRIFKKYLGTTPMRYFTEKKIQTARHLLEETSMSIKEISWKLKFTDQYHFSRVFKKATGFCPSEYRHNCVTTLPDGNHPFPPLLMVK